MSAEGAEATGGEGPRLRPAVPMGDGRHRHGDWVIPDGDCPWRESGDRTEGIESMGREAMTQRRRQTARTEAASKLWAWGWYVLADLVSERAPRATGAAAWDEGWAARAEYDRRCDVPANWPDLNPYRADGADR